MTVIAHIKTSTCTLALASAALANPVTLDFESLDQSGVYGGSGNDGLNTTRIDDQFLADGIDFDGTTSGWDHSRWFSDGADGSTSLVNAYRIDGTDFGTTIEMSAVGSDWDSFSIVALTVTDEVSMSAFDAGGTLLQTVELGQTIGSGDIWQAFAFSVVGIARVEISGAGGDVLLDTIRYDPAAISIIPLPGSGALALVGLVGASVLTRRR